MIKLGITILINIPISAYTKINVAHKKTCHLIDINVKYHFFNISFYSYNSIFYINQ